MKTITLNDKEYKIADYGFGMKCRLEEEGFSLVDFVHKRQSGFMRAYLMLSNRGLNKDIANKVIEGHFIAEGNVDVLVNAINEVMEESDFFHKESENMMKQIQKMQEQMEKMLEEQNSKTDTESTTEANTEA